LPARTRSKGLTTAAYSGLRQGELLALWWGCVDFVGGLLHVRENYTDGRTKVPKGKVRSVPMTPGLLDTLARLKERGYLAADGDLVFCNTAGDHRDPCALRGGITEP
jgi:integrase